MMIDKLCYYSRLRYVNAGEKFAFSIITLILCIISRSIAIGLFVLAVMGILTVWKGGIPLSGYLKLLGIPLGFLLLSTLTILINISRIPLDAFAFSIGSFYITGSYDGIYRGVQLIFTALSGVSCLYFLSLSTPVTDLLNVLKKLRIPPLILELMLLTYRYIFIILNLATDIMTAQHCRLGNRTQKTAWKSFSAMITQVFILSIRRSSAFYDAMESRCYDGNILLISEDLPAKKQEVVCIVLFEILLAVAAAVNIVWR